MTFYTLGCEYHNSHPRLTVRGCAHNPFRRHFSGPSRYVTSPLHSSNSSFGARGECALHGKQPIPSQINLHSSFIQTTHRATQPPSPTHPSFAEGAPCVCLVRLSRFCAPSTDRRLTVFSVFCSATIAPTVTLVRDAAVAHHTNCVDNFFFVGGQNGSPVRGRYYPF